MQPNNHQPPTTNHHKIVILSEVEGPAVAVAVAFALRTEHLAPSTSPFKLS
jgi:hypothetical protein